MKAYVINMATRPDRLAAFRREAAMAGIEYEVFDAITPDQVTIPDTFILPSGSYCNGLSHKAIWQMLLDSDDEAVLIFEDDAVWTGQDFNLPQSSAALKMDMLFLGGNHTEYGAIKGTSIEGNLYRCGHTLTGHAYIIWREAAQFLIDNHDFAHTAIDAGWKKLHDKGDSYYIWPSLWVQRPGYSDIWGRNVDYRNCIG
jgi:GR25 family glycosyltransferase involved in LPS biosynthesis